jgi:hypothetical protein
MANFTTKLTNVTVKKLFPKNEPLELVYITGATGSYTVSIFGTSIGYYLDEVTGGKRMNDLRIGDIAEANGTTEDGQTLHIAKLVCTNAGDTAAFKAVNDLIIE